jgi:hypothetical protein
MRRGRVFAQDHVVNVNSLEDVMKISRIALSALLFGATAVFSSCGDPSPLGPRPPAAAQAAAPVVAPQADLLGGVSNLLKHVGLLSCSALPPATGSKTIGSEGGTINVGPHSFVVPRGALSHPVTITATIEPEHVNHIQFKPEGLQFKKSASLTMSYANCNILNSLLPKHIAHVDEDLNILSLLLSVDNLLARKVTGQVDHFSDYAIAW